MMPGGFLGRAVNQDAADLPEVVSALSLVLELKGRAPRNGHDHAEGW